MNLPQTTATSTAASIIAENIEVAPLVIQLVFFVLFLVCFFVIRYRTWKVISICCAEFCLFLAGKTFFDKDSWIIDIMTWVTAFTIICLSITIVNRINWGSLRGKRKS